MSELAPMRRDMSEVLQGDTDEYRVLMSVLRKKYERIYLARGYMRTFFTASCLVIIGSAVVLLYGLLQTEFLFIFVGLALFLIVMTGSLGAVRGIGRRKRP